MNLKGVCTMEIMFQRGEDTFIVKQNEVFYLVDLYKKKVIKADPPDIPDMFTKWGYFEEVDTVSLPNKQEITKLMLESPVTK